MLVDDICSIADEPVVLNPRDRRAEGANTVWISVSDEDRNPALLPAVVAAFGQVAAAIRERVAASGHLGPVTFYVWHDEQAGQLRCSTATLPPDRLPFGGAHYVTDDPAEVIAGFLDDQSPGLVLWSELESVDFDSMEPDPPMPPSPVWAIDVSAAK